MFPAGFYVDGNKKVYTPEKSPHITLAAKKKALSGSNPNIWCPAADVLLTRAIELHDNYNLKELVEEFNLSGNLIGAYS